MAQEQASLSLPMDIIQPLIQAKVQSAVLEAIGGQGEIITSIVNKILAEKVGSDGKPSNYSYDQTPWFEWAVRDLLKKAITAALQEHLATKKEEIATLLRGELAKKNSKLAKDFAIGMAEGMSRLCEHYRMTVTFAEHQR